MTARREDKSLPALVSELWELIVAYAKQETVDPLKSLGRFIAYGVIGSVCIGLGGFLIALGGLRALQTELTVEHPNLRGNLDWIPYLGAAAFCLIVAGLAVSRIGKVPRGRQR